MLYDNSNNGGGIGSGDKKRVELVLISLSNLYSLLDSILVSVSGPFSCFTLYHLLTTYSVNYYSNQIVYKYLSEGNAYSRWDS